jgi:signal transduction histidine kinase
MALAVLFPRVGSIAGIFGLGAVLVGAFCFGLRGGLFAALTQLGLNAAAMQFVIHPDVAIDGPSVVGILFYFVAGAVVGNQRDLSRKLRVELSLNERLRVRERETLAAIPDALIRIDSSGACAYQPEPGLKSLEKALEHALNQSLPIDRMAAVNEVVAKVRTTATAQGLTLELPGPAYFEVRALPAADASVLVLIRDVTDQRRLLRRVAAAENLASLGTLAAGLAHEINNPLTFVITNLTSIKESLGTSAGNVKPELNAALDGCWRIRDIVRDIQDTTTNQQDMVTVVHAPEVIDAALELVKIQVRHRATIIWNCEEVLCVLGHRTKLMQVVANLVANASQAFQDNRVSVNHIVVRCFREDQAVVIEVEDNGPGMDETTRLRAIEPFFTTKEPGQGVGLGLFLCNAIVESLGGKLQIDSEPGRGTKVSVRLRRSAEVPPASCVESGDAPVTNGESSRLKVLVVDDEPEIRRGLRRILDKKHDVALSTNGAEALARFVAGERYDVVLCDVLMPEMTGIELSVELDRRFPEQSDRVVFMTGGATSESARLFIEEKHARVVSKPFTPREIESAIRVFALRA